MAEPAPPAPTSSAFLPAGTQPLSFMAVTKPRPSNMSPCQLPSGLRRMVLTVRRKAARSDVVAHSAKQANLCGTVAMMPSTFFASDTPASQAARSAGVTWAGIT